MLEALMSFWLPTMAGVFWRLYICVFLPSFCLALPVDDSDWYSHLRYQIRLVGDTPFKGRLEVFYNGEWGTVCDDNFTPYGCSLVCKQLGFWNGTCISIVSSECLMKRNGDFEVGRGRIWLDDVKCNGYELRLDECQHSPWGKINCFHDEDVGCVCTPHRENCNSSRHRIIPIENSTSAIGIVEIQDDSGMWGAVCDDNWDDFDAAVFCKCLGYKDVESFRALSLGRPMHTILNYEGFFVFDEVHCPPEDNFFTKNLWDCETIANRPSHCNIRSELAIVQCDGSGSGFASVRDPDRINASVFCSDRTLVLCIHPLFEFEVGLATLEISPFCQEALLKEYDVDIGFCYEIDLLLCPPIESSQRLPEIKNYCYDVSFKVPDNIFFLGGVTRRGCCSMNKSLQVEALFPPHSFKGYESSKPVVVDSLKPKLSMPCFQLDSSELRNISNESVAGRGSTVFCKVMADLWDDDLQLVVQNCKFLATSGEINVDRVSSYAFFKDKCVLTDLLGIKIFNGGKHSWGFSFYLPKFESSSDVYLTCDVFFCDIKRDGKQLCDRSCDLDGFVPSEPVPSERSYESSTATADDGALQGRSDGGTKDGGADDEPQNESDVSLNRVERRARSDDGKRMELVEVVTLIQVGDVGGGQSMSEAASSVFGEYLRTPAILFSAAIIWLCLFLLMQKHVQ